MSQSSGALDGAPGGKVPLSGAPWDNREMTSTPAHLTGLCNPVNYFVFSRGVYSSFCVLTVKKSNLSLYKGKTRPFLWEVLYQSCDLYFQRSQRWKRLFDLTRASWWKLGKMLQKEGDWWWVFSFRDCWTSFGWKRKSQWTLPAENMWSSLMWSFKWNQAESREGERRQLSLWRPALNGILDNPPPQRCSASVSCQMQCFIASTFTCL